MTQQLQTSAIFNLRQLETIILDTTADQYAKPLDILSGSSIGMHIRHILEFYQCLLSQYTSKEINYDARVRNVNIETNLTFCIQTLHQLINHIENLQENEDISLFTHQSLEGKGHLIPSNLFRELNYVIEHAIHHMAILKIAYAHHFPEINLPPHFGVAFSTIKHQQLVHSKLSAS